MTVLVQKLSLGIMTLALIAIAVVAMGGESMAASRYAEAQYRVVQTLRQSIEIREYAPQLVAEVTVAGSRNEAANKGFRQLFAYITGANTTQQSVAMTTPVVEKQSESIAMTTPVTESPSKEGWVIRFFLPTHYTLKTIPKPTNCSRRIIISWMYRY
jgi:D-arabinose 1-dehydrogenase-like Zn-dependent alcohol dehydrogenase